MDAPALYLNKNLRFSVLRRSKGDMSELKFTMLTKSGKWVSGHFGLHKGEPLSHAFAFLKQIVASHILIQNLEAKEFSISINSTHDTL